MKENQLSNPGLVTDQDCEAYITIRGKGWVCEINNRIAGFATAGLKDHCIRALFIHPDHERKGIANNSTTSCLPGISKNKNNRLAGDFAVYKSREVLLSGRWKAVGKHGQGEMKFEMSYEAWSELRGYANR